MKSFFTVIFLVIITFGVNSYSQIIFDYESQKENIEKGFLEKGEIYFKFTVPGRSDLNNLSRIISIDYVKDLLIGYEVFAYANRDEFNNFLKLNLQFQLLKHPGKPDFQLKSSSNPDEIMAAWDVYPTYSGYVAMMNQFQTSYPGLCQIVDAGNTVLGKKILFAKISDSVNFRKPKPRFMFSSTIHGDETTGFVLMLRLIDTLLKGYGSDPKITKLVKNCEIWINPNANPDGSYRNTDLLNNPTRYNWNGKDLNRNFPDPVAGPNPTGTWQPETIAMMNLMSQYNFTLSGNFHGGAEVANYPWDCKSALHPDDLWFIKICKDYVDTVHAFSPSTYMDDLYGYPNIPGVTNGYAWYSVAGGRQDYMTFFKGGREVTFEISNTKFLNPSQLPVHWQYHNKSFFNYIEETLFGIRGIVTDSVSGLPLKAKVYVIGQNDSTFVFSDSVCGDYHRMIATGTYSLKFTAPNHIPKIINNVYAKYDSTTILNVQLAPNPTNIRRENMVVNDYYLEQNYPNPFNAITNVRFRILKQGYTKLEIFDISGKKVSTILNELLNPGSYEISIDATELSSGIYFYRLISNDFSDTRKMIITK